MLNSLKRTSDEFGYITDISIDMRWKLRRNTTIVSGLTLKNNTIMTHAMKFNNDTKENRYEAMKAAFRDMYEYYHRQDKPLITASVRQLNEYFMNLECS